MFLYGSVRVGKWITEVHVTQSIEHFVSVLARSVLQKRNPLSRAGLKVGVHMMKKLLTAIVTKENVLWVLQVVALLLDIVSKVLHWLQ